MIVLEWYAIYVAGACILLLVVLLFHLRRDRKKAELARRKVEPCGPRVQVWNDKERERRKIVKLRMLVR